MPETIAECTNINIKDNRLNKRFKKCIETMLGSPSASLPSTFRDYHQTKALYRFLVTIQNPLHEVLKSGFLFDMMCPYALKRQVLLRDFTYQRSKVGVSE